METRTVNVHSCPNTNVFCISQDLKEVKIYLGDNSVFEDFTASIGDLMMANWVYWQRVNWASKRIFATKKSTIDAVKCSNTIQLSPF